MTAQLLNQIDLLLHDEVPDLYAPRTISCPKCLRMFSHSIYLDVHTRFNSDCAAADLIDFSVPEEEYETLHAYSEADEVEHPSAETHIYSGRSDTEGEPAKQKPISPCTFCGKALEGGLRDRNAHYRNRHKHKRAFEDIIECVVCGQEVNGVKGLNEHYDAEHPRKSGGHKALQRASTVGEAASLKAFQRIQKPAQTGVATEVKHEGETRPITCAFCNGKFRNKHSLRTHTRATHPDKGDGKAREVPRLSSTPIAQAGPLKSVSLPSHIEMKLGARRTSRKINQRRGSPGPATPMLSLLARTVQSRSPLSAPNNNAQSHNRTRPFRCIICGRAFTDERGLRNHTRGKHAVEQKDKGKELQNSLGKSTKHTPPLPQTSPLANRMQHVSLTTGTHHGAEKPDKPHRVTCDTCKRIFATEFDLGRHIRAMHREKGKGKAREVPESPSRDVSDSCPLIPGPEVTQNPPLDDEGDLMLSTFGPTLTKEGFLKYLQDLKSRSESEKDIDQEPTGEDAKSRSATTKTKEHISEHRSETKEQSAAVSCNVCRKLFRSKHGLHLHTQAKHCNHNDDEVAIVPVTPVGQKKIKKKIPSPVTDTTEEPAAIQEGPFICIACGSSFKTNKNLDRHCRVKHADIPAYDDQVAEYSSGSGELCVLVGETGKQSGNTLAKREKRHKRNGCKIAVDEHSQASHSQESGYVADTDTKMEHSKRGRGGRG